jgi:hypothetical protein
MPTGPQKDEPSAVRKLTPEEEKKGVRTVGFILLGFFAFIIAILVGVAAIR